MRFVHTKCDMQVSIQLETGMHIDMCYVSIHDDAR